MNDRFAIDVFLDTVTNGETSACHLRVFLYLLLNILCSEHFSPQTPPVPNTHLPLTSLHCIKLVTEKGRTSLKTTKLVEL